MHFHRIASVFVDALADNCSHLISRDFNATIKHRFAGRIKEINEKIQSSGGFVGGYDGVAGGRDAYVGGFVQSDVELSRSPVFISRTDESSRRSSLWDHRESGTDVYTARIAKIRISSRTCGKKYTEIRNVDLLTQTIFATLIVFTPRSVIFYKF